MMTLAQILAAVRQFLDPLGAFEAAQKKERKS